MPEKVPSQDLPHNGSTNRRSNRATDRADASVRLERISPQASTAVAPYHKPKAQPRQSTFIDRLSLWAQSGDGIAFLAVLGLVLIFGTLWLIDDAMRSPVSATGDQVIQLSADLDADDPILALVRGAPVKLSQVREFARQTEAAGADELTAVTALERGLVRDLVDQQLLANAAIASGTARSADVTGRVNIARQRILAAAMLETEIERLVTPEKARAIFDKQRAALAQGDEVRARHILLEDAQTAAQLHNALQQGVLFEEVVGTYSNDQNTKFKGGDLGYFTFAMMDPAISKAAFNTKVGEYAALFQSAKGWHILQVRGRRRAAAPSYVESKDDLMAFLKLKAIDRTVTDLRKQADVVFAEVVSVQPAQVTADPDATSKQSTPDVK